MRWLRSPFWDGCWIWSGLPIGLLLATGIIPPRVIFYTYIALNTAHLFAPVAAAWSHAGFRGVMMQRKRKFVGIPLAVLGIGVVCGLIGGQYAINPLTLSIMMPSVDNLRDPLMMLMTVYFFWNAYHFGMQNYGVSRIYFPQFDRAVAMQAAMFGTVFLLIIVPEKYHTQSLTLFCVGAVMFNHQLAALGIASHVWANHHRRSTIWFVAPLLLVGAFAAWAVGTFGVALILIGLRTSAGLVHFLYDRWVYKFSDPQVRATIGRDLFLFGPPKLRLALEG